MIAQAGRSHIGLRRGGDRGDLLPRILFEFDDKNGAGITLYEEPVFALFDIVLCAFQDEVVDELAGSGMIAQSDKIGPERFVDVMEMDTKQSRLFRRQRRQVELDLGQKGQCALRSCE